MSLYETSYGQRLACLISTVRTLKEGRLPKSDKAALLAKARRDAAALGIDLGSYNSSNFAANVPRLIAG